MTHGRYHPDHRSAKLVGRAGRRWQPDRAAHAPLRVSRSSRVVDTAGAYERRHGSVPCLQGLNPGGDRRAQFGYTIPNLLIDHAMRNPHIPPRFWRGVNNNQNAIYLECFMDELAHGGRRRTRSSSGAS